MINVCDNELFAGARSMRAYTIHEGRVGGTSSGFDVKVNSTTK